MNVEELTSVAAAHARALARAAAAGDRRARAVFEARGAGASLGQIAAALGVSRPTALELVRRGEALGPGSPPGAGDDAAPAAASRVTPPAAGGARCLREGCPLEASEGARFCPAHRWS